MSAAQQIEPSEKAKIRSLPIEFWPEADRKAWISACRPSQRLKRGGAGSHMKPITSTISHGATATSWIA